MNIRRGLDWFGLVMAVAIFGLVVVTEFVTPSGTALWWFVGVVLLVLGVVAMLLSFKDMDDTSGAVPWFSVNPWLLFALWSMAGAVMGCLLINEPTSKPPYIALAAFYPCLRSGIWFAGRLRQRSREARTPHHTG